MIPNQAAPYVWSHLGHSKQLVGAIEMVNGRGKFLYAPTYINGGGPSVDPINLPLDPEPRETMANGGVFGVLTDAGPGAWGKRILTNLHPCQMAKASPLDVLMMTCGNGIGALMISGSPTTVKPRSLGIALEDLGAAAEAAHRVEIGEVLSERLREIIDAGSSLGGVNPKVAVVHQDGSEWIAKFRGLQDSVDTPRVELASMRLARDCGIDAAEVQPTAIGERFALLVRRFDRNAGGVLHYASAHALWNRASASEASTLDWASYAGIAELRRKLPGKGVRFDLEELFRRLVFNVVIGNTDDHGRNHGFLMNPVGDWHLSPAFDLIPTMRGAGKVQSLGVGPTGRDRSLDNVLAGAASFRLGRPKAKEIASHIIDTISTRWSDRLKEADVAAADIKVVQERMLSKTLK